MRKQQQGFTLIEIAIVLVIIGLLLGGVLKGQELIQNARVRNVIAQQDGVKAAFFGFQDRYRGIPGDYSIPNASANVPGAGTVCGGNGDGLIQSTTAAGSASPESVCAWYHMLRAGFIAGSFSGNGANEAAGNAPANAFGGIQQIIFDSVYAANNGNNVHNVKTGVNIPAALLAEVDRKIDDGLPDSGSFRFSTYAPPGVPNPTAATCEPPNATTGVNNWAVSSNATQCGGASLF